METALESPQSTLSGMMGNFATRHPFAPIFFATGSSLQQSRASRGQRVYDKELEKESLQEKSCLSWLATLPVCTCSAFLALNA